MFSIDLDSPPQERFKEVMTHFKPQALALIKSYLDLVPPVLLDVLPLFTWLPELFQPDYMAEIRGISEVMGLSKDLGIAVNFIYEL